MAATIDFRNRRGKLQCMSSIGQRVRRLRKEADLSQVELSKLLGIDQSTLSDIERDKNDAFTGKVLIRMAQALKKSPFFIMEGVGTGLEDGESALEELELLLAFRRANKDDQAVLLRMARAFSATAKPHPSEQ